MKKILFVLAAGITIMSCSDGEKKADSIASNADSVTTTTPGSDTAKANSQPATPAAPTVDPATLTKIEWLDGGIDRKFGKITEGQTLNVVFKFKNVGDKPLVISNVSAQCGCTIPETPQKPFAPGETGEIKAQFNSTGKPGQQSKQVYVDANTDPQKTTLTFHVEVKSKS